MWAAPANAGGGLPKVSVEGKSPTEISGRVTFNLPAYEKGFIIFSAGKH